MSTPVEYILDPNNNSGALYHLNKHYSNESSLKKIISSFFSKIVTLLQLDGSFLVLVNHIILQDQNLQS